MLMLDFWWPYAKLCPRWGGGGGEGGGERMDEMHLFMFHSILNRVCRKCSRISIYSAAQYTLSTLYFFVSNLGQETVRHSRYMI